MSARMTMRNAAVGCVLFLIASLVQAQDQNPTFDIWEIRVQGNSLLEGRQIENAVYDFLGPDRSFADVQSARSAIESLYREQGYPTVLVDVPEQSVQGGLVRIRVTEGTIDSVRITGARYYSNGWIRDNVPEAQTGIVPRLAAFNGQIAQLNTRTSDRRITPVLKPGGEPGTVELELKVKDELPLHASVELNNRNTIATTDTRLVAEVSYSNLWQRDHKVGLLYQVAPEATEESEIISLNYSFRPELSSTTYAFYGVRSNSDIETTGAIGILGRGSIVGARAITPLPNTDRVFQSLILGVDWKDFEENIGFEEAIETPITYVNWTVGYTAAIIEPSRRHNMFWSANFGVRGLVNDPQEFSGDVDDDTGLCAAAKRCGSKANYFYLRGSYDVRQSLPFGTAAFFKFTGQWTANPLISNEQYAIGGVDTVRGYFEAESLGDYGAHGTLEFRTPDLGRRLSDNIRTGYLYAFADGGRIGTRPSPGDTETDRSVRISSAGIGLNFEGFGFLGVLNWAYPLQDGPVTEKGDTRLLFRARYGF